jgi:hypothetical protein
MQAEDIIQQKEWNELSSEEKRTIQPLAADEQEFNLLKKMLLFAGEETADVPLLAPEVPLELKAAIAAPAPSVRKINWYYVAAAILILVFPTWFVLTDKEAREGTPIAGTDLKGYDTLIGQSTIYVLPGDPIEITHYAPPKGSIRKDSIPTSTVRQPNKPPVEIIQPKYAAVSTLVKSDTALMAFITAVY